MITDNTKVIAVNNTSDILETLVILGGAALLGGDRRLYDHIMRAKVQYEQGVNLHLTDYISGPRN